MKIVLLANTDWFLYNFLFPLANKLKDIGHDVVLVSPTGKYSDVLADKGFRHVPLKLSRSGMNPASEIFAIRHLYALYQREQPDIVHHFTVKCVLYGSIAAKLANLPSIVNTIPGLGHVFVDQGWRPRMLRPLVTMMYCAALRATQVIFINPDNRDVFLGHNLVHAYSSHLIRGSGVDVEQYAPSGRASIGAKVQILFAGRLLWSKGLGEFMEAARLAQKSMPDLRFVVAGEPDIGNPSCISEGVVEGWKKNGNVQFIGHSGDMRGLIANSHIAVLPSYGEGLAQFLLEAASCGLPLVASDVSGCREIVRDGVNGYLVPARDASALACAILKLARSTELRAVMGAESRRMVCAEFSQEQVLQRTLEVYCTALNRGKHLDPQPISSWIEPQTNTGLRR